MFMEIAKNTAFIILFFMFTLATFTFIFKNEKTFITIGLTNLDLRFRVERYDKIFGMWSLRF